MPAVISVLIVMRSIRVDENTGVCFNFYMWIMLHIWRHFHEEVECCV